MAVESSLSGDDQSSGFGRRTISHAPTPAIATTTRPIPMPSQTPASGGGADDEASGCDVTAGAAPHAGCAEPAAFGPAETEASGAYVKVYVPETGWPSEE